jgi:hypothetical protein
METIGIAKFKDGNRRLSVTVDWVRANFPETPDAPIRAGARVVKCLDEPDDGHKIGDLATVITSSGPMPENTDCNPAWWGLYMYFVIWDDAPEIPVGIMSHKIKEHTDESATPGTGSTASPNAESAD